MMRVTSSDERRAESWAVSGSTSQDENRTSGRATRESAIRATSQAACRAAGQAATRTANETAIQAAGIPSPDIWAGISADERAYRKRVLDDITRRVAEEGVHTAVPSDDRGRQFMPFAALKGYDDIVRDSQEPARQCCGHARQPAPIRERERASLCHATRGFRDAELATSLAATS